MRAVLEVRSGSDAARTIVVGDEAARTIGRSSAADEPFPHDPYMNDVHAAFWMRGDHCYVRDLGSTHGTWVNQRGVREELLRDGDLVQVGGTLLALRVEALPTRREEPSTYANRAEHVLRFLCTGEGGLFGILDSARDEQVLPFLYGSGLQFQSLYEGLRGEELALVAPYLVSLPPDAPALAELVEQAWGASWGVFLRTASSFRDLRRHLRRLLRVELDDGAQVLFRFYDPRVLRAYLPTCTGDEAAQVFGPVTHYLTEGRRETAMRFRPTSDGVVVDVEALTQDLAADARLPR